MLRITPSFQNFAFEIANHRMTAVLTFEPEGEGTRYTARVRHWSESDREAHEEMGFHDGWGAATDQLVAARLRPLVDELVALAEVAGLMAVGAWYERFEQLDDAQVKALMDAGKRDQPSSEAAIPPRGTAGQL